MKNRLFPFLAGVMLFLAASALRAESQTAASPEPNMEKARASFQQGVQLFHEGSFEAAVAEFRKTYRLAPSYRILYNIGQAYFELHDYVSALKTFKQYLSDGGREITASRRSEVEELNQKLGARIAYLDIDVNLDGAEVRVDDIIVGESPLPTAILVNAGPRRILVVKAGYTSAARSLTVAGAERVRVELNLREAVSNSTPQQTGIVGHARTSRSTLDRRTALFASVAATGACALATGILGWLTLDAKKTFDQQLNTIPTTKGSLDFARSKVTTYAVITDGLGAATLVAGGLSLYFALTGRHDGDREGRSTGRTSVALVPTLGGMLLSGQF